MQGRISSIPLAFAFKQFLTASNIDFSDILETTSYFVLPPWCIGPPKIVLDLVHLKKDHTDACVYKQLFMDFQDGYRDYIPVYTERLQTFYVNSICLTHNTRFIFVLGCQTFIQSVSLLHAPTINDVKVVTLI